MDKKATQIKYRRTRKKYPRQLEALTRAQEIIFAPFTFQVIASLIDFGVLELLNRKPSDLDEIISSCKISRYCAKTLFEAATVAGITECNDKKFSLTELGRTFLENEMTRVNFNFMKDVCYLGASEIEKSFKTGKPEGLKKYLGDYPTIYPALSKLPENVQKSWYAFDHYYSDTCFEEVLKIIFKDDPKEIFDIGGNTGKFENACLAYNKDCKITLLDLPENLERAKSNVPSERCGFYGINVIAPDAKFPEMSGAVFMSQFLDCFSEEQIISILSNIAKYSDDNIHIYILEPFIDNQNFKGAEYSLTHISLYFTCMANGNSKMYTEKDMREFIDKAGLKVKEKYAIGIHDYTLLECIKNEVV